MGYLKDNIEMMKQPKQLQRHPFLHLNTPWCHCTVASIPFLHLLKHLHYLHMENHALGEAPTFKITLQLWVILDLWMGGIKTCYELPKWCKALLLGTIIFHLST
jgi:hypothetical protein